MGLQAWSRRVLTLALALLLAAAGLAHGRTVLELDLTRQPIPLADWGDAWLDATGETQIDHVSSDPAIPWQPTAQDAIYPLTTGKVLWIRFTVPPAPDRERWYLEVPYPSVNRATLYSRDPLDRWQPQHAGDTLPVADWPVPHRHPLLPLAVSAVHPRHYMLRVENPHSFSAPLTFVSESYLGRTEQRTSFVLGMYFGLAALALVLSVLGAASLRDRAYWLYAGSVALLALTQAAMTGLAGLHLWPRSPWWADVSPIVLPVLGVGVVQLFFAAVVSLADRSRRLNLLVTATGLLSIPVALAILWVEPSQRIKWMVPYIVVASHVGLGAVIWAARRGDRYAWWLLAGSLPVAIGAIFPLARTAGYIPVSFLTMYGMQIGIAVELPLLLVMLMLRSQARREQRRRVQGLDRIDPATGVLNAHVFHERLVRLIARSVRLKLRSAILLVDIVNLEQIRRDYDGEAAQELPLRVAGRLLKASREIDSVARLSDHRFGILLEGPLKADEVAEAAPRVVAQCLLPFKNRPIDWAAQVHVAQALIPMDGTDAVDLIARLEALLAGAPMDGKSAVFLLSRPHLPTGLVPATSPVTS
ncbi:diguanylate cyclase [Caenimonas sedimenti]|uniref:Diguanylate cyclase n=1 Tax=Caenimonas sedimenti TaxID=2596921 RepID=A0A562ZUZ4_9BURK|nr:7TM diverse intracellular signaling domain-containing protein [Caenimonas sedimenti]TWO72135.1 diguanylate cyclase [Caenimonas sedimenti]